LLLILVTLDHSINQTWIFDLIRWISFLPNLRFSVFFLSTGLRLFVDTILRHYIDSSDTAKRPVKAATASHGKYHRSSTPIHQLHGSGKLSFSWPISL